MLALGLESVMRLCLVLASWLVWIELGKGERGWCCHFFCRILCMSDCFPRQRMLHHQVCRSQMHPFFSSQQSSPSFWVSPSVPHQAPCIPFLLLVDQVLLLNLCRWLHCILRHYHLTSLTSFFVLLLGFLFHPQSLSLGFSHTTLLSRDAVLTCDIRSLQ